MPLAADDAKQRVNDSTRRSLIAVERHGASVGRGSLKQERQWINWINAEETIKCRFYYFKVFQIQTKFFWPWMPCYWSRRAEKSGRGFAVVADEVRGLASNTQKADGANRKHYFAVCKWSGPLLKMVLHSWWDYAQTSVRYRQTIRLTHLNEASKLRGQCE